MPRQIRYDAAAIVLHWLMALLLTAQLLLGLTMSRIADQRSAFELIQLHKSIGLTLLGLIGLRLVWRLANRPPPLPDGMPLWERQAARFAHAVLYLLMLVLPLTGWALVSVSVLAVPTMPFGLFVLPNLPLPMSEAAELLWGCLHGLLAWALVGVVALHVLAALRHHFWLRDGVLTRMAWRWRDAGGPPRRE